MPRQLGTGDANVSAGIAPGRMIVQPASARPARGGTRIGAAHPLRQIASAERIARAAGIDRIQHGVGR
jgi:hypothetical protein